MLFRLEFVLYIIEFLNEFQEENSYVLELVTTLLKIPKKRTKKHGLRGFTRLISAYLTWL